MSAPSPFAGWTEFYDPDFYEAEIGDGDRVGSAYVELVGGRSGIHVIEVGCGPGAIVFALAATGVRRITGIDRSAAMIDRANKRLRERAASLSAQVKFQRADVLEFEPDEAADAILLANELVLHFLLPGELVAALVRCRLALSAHGRLILDLPEADYSLMAERLRAPVTIVRGTFPLGDTGQAVRVVEDIEIDHANWTKTTQFRYERISESGTLGATLFRRLVQRMWTIQEVRFALMLAGFERVEIVAMDQHPNRRFLSATGAR